MPTLPHSLRPPSFGSWRALPPRNPLPCTVLPVLYVPRDEITHVLPAAGLATVATAGSATGTRLLTGNGTAGNACDTGACAPIAASAPPDTTSNLRPTTDTADTFPRTGELHCSNDRGGDRYRTAGSCRHVSALWVYVVIWLSDSGGDRSMPSMYGSTSRALTVKRTMPAEAAACRQSALFSAWRAVVLHGSCGGST